MKLDLGCGQNRREGFTGVDIATLPTVDVVHDLRILPWPFDSETIEEIWCSHFVEHLTGQERMGFMNELGRILLRGSKATIITPYWSSMRAVQDPTHQWPPLCEMSFLYFNKEWRTQNRLDHYPLTCDFDFTYGYDIAPQWQQRHFEAKQYAVAHYTNVAMDLHVTLVKR